jgi:hydroxypyruvate isomerase
MPRFAANISTMFADRPFLDRVDAAAAAGFAAVECQFPYEVGKEELKACFDGTSGGMVDWGRRPFESRLERIGILAEIVEQPSRSAPPVRTELGCMGAREIGNTIQVIVQELPVGAILPIGGVGMVVPS